MNKIFQSDFLNKYFAEGLEKEDFTLEDLRKIGMVAIVNEDPEKTIKITSEDLEILCSLGKEDFDFEGIDLNGVEFPKTVIKDLSFSNCKLSTCNFSNLQVEGDLALFENNELKNNGIGQFTHMEGIERLWCIDCENLDLAELSNLKNIKNLRIKGKEENLSSVSDLRQLETLNILGISGILPYLPDSIKTIEIDDPNLLDISLLRNYSNLERVELLSSKLDISQIDTICELKRNGIRIVFDETKFKEQLSERKYEFEENDLEAVKRLFGLSGDIELNDYELLSHLGSKQLRLKVRDISILDKLIKSGLLSEDSIISKSCDIEGIDLLLDNLEGISQNVLEYISQNKNKNFRFVTRTLNGLDSKVLEGLNENEENIEFYVQDDMFHFQDKKGVDSFKAKHISFNDLDDLVPYKLEDMKEFISVLEPIKEQSLETENDLEKFAMIRKIALMSLKYDYSGLINSDKFKEGREMITRSLKGVFLEGKAVCAGNSLGFLVMSEYVGLKAKCIGGKTIDTDSRGHEWNQIRITDENSNPTWYNYDLTNDPDVLDDESQGILEDDETFYKRNTPSKLEKVEKCSKNMPNDNIRKADLKRSLKEESTLEDLILSSEKPTVKATPGQYSGKKITKQDIKAILGSLTLSEVNYYTKIFSQPVRRNSLGMERA